MIKLVDATREVKNWPQFPHPSYRLKIISGSPSGKINSVFNLIKH